mmetsp:Transcript_4771/g.10145  ORF Transcript_4771/g.10145 Transcript_4771/m.10145 type:complete len:482 (-) Transcript_4771:199-1644(-)|eukprot:CAMPEP_0172440240 /NCGR_PEP_ID=MMETSP1065-20121228/934_1 /TAXON_ID=265537 /ORGANISM="Amphiprora paludosa, Strain CCMP125" /LENGTH=481 /DNA_ID=CAMNT_0013189025 /DNA_START=170 /DNA_END=1615 /DNA_ORIENTATION=-
MPPNQSDIASLVTSNDDDSIIMNRILPGVFQKSSTKKDSKTKMANATATTGTVTADNQLRPLHCVAQQYAWGRLGSSSSVALMKDAQAMEEDDDMFSIDEDKPYAELWLGTHPNGMSMVTVKDENEDEASPSTEANKHSLLDYIRQDPELHCGDANCQDISYLLKVLSVRKVLSIQAHPDKATAEQLHADHPKIYKDPNHKPEMAIALSEKVRAMIGFRPLAEIAQHLEEYPEFKAVIGAKTAEEIQKLDVSPEAVKDALQHMFQGYLEQPDEVIHKNVDDLVDRLRKMEHHDDIQKLILQLEQQFPGDCGIFAPLMLNVSELEYGQGLYIGANEPHAYISGEILECMACSDNVVRAGLTPKLKDVPTLVNMLTYKSCEPDIQNGTPIDEFTTRYQPPVEDFCVEVVYVPAGAKYELSDIASPSVLLTLEGDAQLTQGDVCTMNITFGSAAFCSANTKCTIEAGPYGVRLTRAFTNVFHKN